VIEVIDSFLNVIYFFFIGTLLPWPTFAEIGYGRLIGYAAWVLLLRRIPVVLACWKLAPSLETIQDALLAAWFGYAFIRGFIIGRLVCVVPKRQEQALSTMLLR
jgi:NhaP-type Na+/H+ or K+/H+ antiporter